MKEISQTFYLCEICNKAYHTKKEAKRCEAKPMTNDKGAQVGDIVIITNGQSKGKKAKISKRWVYDREWGHYAWERYWHTVGLVADIIDSSFSRQLTFDDYELV